MHYCLAPADSIRILLCYTLYPTVVHCMTAHVKVWTTRKQSIRQMCNDTIQPSGNVLSALYYAQHHNSI